MKRLLFLALICLPAISVFSQCEDYCLNFEDTLCFNRLQVDSAIIDNTWQIGPPQKTSFNTAYSEPNVIITDTLNSYPANDSSVFYIYNPVNEGDIYGLSIMYGQYSANTDSLHDFGKMEFSVDGGQNWVDLLTENKFSSSYNWWTMKPVLTGNSGGWKYFEVILSDIGSVFDLELGDTITYRFTFVSDDISENLDGIMFDNICFSSFVEGISEKRFIPLKSKIFPNPSNDIFTIEFDNPENQIFHLAVYNSQSVMQFLNKNVTEGFYTFEANTLKPGIYIYKLTNPKSLQRSWGKFIVVE